VPETERPAADAVRNRGGKVRSFADKA